MKVPKFKPWLIDYFDGVNGSGPFFYTRGQALPSEVARAFWKGECRFYTRFTADAALAMRFMDNNEKGPGQ